MKLARSATTIVFGLLAPFLWGGGKEHRPMTTTPTSTSARQPSISRDQALQIARADAEKIYRDLSGYRVDLKLEHDGWHVDYELKDPELDGGGPHYVIDPVSGKILSKRYEQ